MTAGISGTGPYAQLRTLKTLAEHCAYELREFRHGPRKRAALERLAADIAGRIARVRASIKAAGERSYERMNAMDIDTADHVHHAPSGEDWVVAYVRGDRLAWCGWPPGEAALSDCTLLKKATPDERDKLLSDMADLGHDMRATRYAGQTGGPPQDA